MRISDFGFRKAWGMEHFKISDFGFRNADFGMRTSDCGLRISDCGMRISEGIGHGAWSFLKHGHCQFLAACSLLALSLSKGCPLDAASPTRLHGKADEKIVSGFLEQSSFSTQLHYGARLITLKPSLSGCASSSNSTAQVYSKRESVC